MNPEETEISKLSTRLAMANKLQQMTLDNQIRAVERADALQKEHDYLAKTLLETRQVRDSWCDEYTKMRDAAEMLWVVLANVDGGDWSKQSAEWQQAAARWRDEFHKVANVKRPQAGRAAGAGVGLEPPAADKGHN
jgi:hypothetical protein